MKNKNKVEGGNQMGVRCACGRICHLGTPCDCCNGNDLDAAISSIDQKERRTDRTMDLCEMMEFAEAQILPRKGVS